MDEEKQSQESQIHIEPVPTEQTYLAGEILVVVRGPKGGKSWHIQGVSLKDKVKVKDYHAIPDLYEVEVTVHDGEPVQYGTEFFASRDMLERP